MKNKKPTKKFNLNKNIKNNAKRVKEYKDGILLDKKDKNDLEWYIG